MAITPVILSTACLISSILKSTSCFVGYCQKMKHCIRASSHSYVKRHCVEHCVSGCYGSGQHRIVAVSIIFICALHYYAAAFINKAIRLEWVESTVPFPRKEQVPIASLSEFMEFAVNIPEQDPHVGQPSCSSTSISESGTVLSAESIIMSMRPSLRPLEFLPPLALQKRIQSGYSISWRP